MKRQNRFRQAAQTKIVITSKQLKAIAKKLKTSQIDHTCLDECIKQLMQAKTDIVMSTAKITTKVVTNETKEIQVEIKAEFKKEEEKNKFPRISRSKQKVT